MTRAQLEALAARFEAAPANDAALFFEALDALALPRPLHYRIVRFIYGEAFNDAAASLVDDGWEWSVRRACDEHSPMRHFGGRNGGCYDAEAGPWGRPKRATAATPALALTAAALRARAMEAGDA
jgi:hypothetical protein